MFLVCYHNEIANHYSPYDDCHNSHASNGIELHVLPWPSLIHLTAINTELNTPPTVDAFGVLMLRLTVYHDWHGYILQEMDGRLCWVHQVDVECPNDFMGETEG